MLYRTVRSLLLATAGVGVLVTCTQSNSEEQEAAEATFVRDELSVQHGQALFNQHCAACHGFEEVIIGPNLSGITAEQDKEWLASFISNAPKMIDEGDERAQQLYEK